MLPPHKILLPVDYSERCFEIARQAVELARCFGCEITALRVEPVSLDAAGRRKAESRLEQFTDHELSSIRARRLTRTGDAVAEILRQASEDKPDLIMMPTRGFSSFRLLLLGSVTAKVLQHAMCPVWTGPHGASSSDSSRIPPRHIVCAVALGFGASEGFAWASALAKAYRAGLTVLHVAPRAELPTGTGVPLWKSHPLGSREIVVETGDASKAVPALARQLSADLLVLDRNPMGERRSRSEEYQIILGAPGAVLRL